MGTDQGVPGSGLRFLHHKSCRKPLQGEPDKIGAVTDYDENLLGLQGDRRPIDPSQHWDSAYFMQNLGTAADHACTLAGRQNECAKAFHSLWPGKVISTCVLEISHGAMRGGGFCPRGRAAEPFGRLV